MCYNYVYGGYKYVKFDRYNRADVGSNKTKCANVGTIIADSTNVIYCDKFYTWFNFRNNT